jgi:hypothetical protein
MTAIAGFDWAVSSMTHEGVEVRCKVCMKVFIKTTTTRKHDATAYERHEKTAIHQKRLREMTRSSPGSLTKFLGKGREQVNNYLTFVIHGVQSDQSFSNISDNMSVSEDMHQRVSVFQDNT